MKKMILFSVLGSLCLFFNGFAQEPNSHHQLTVGDAMPDVRIMNLSNYPANEAKISDFRGRLLILDFWSTWCGTCLKQFPHCDSLVTKFKDRLTIVLVNSELKSGDDWNRIKYAFSHGYKPRHLPVAYNDTTLRGLLKHHSLPHYVWINPKGVICGITDHLALTEQHINAILKHEQVLLPLKADD